MTENCIMDFVKGSTQDVDILSIHDISASGGNMKIPKDV
jgi:hypothetical protein